MKLKGCQYDSIWYLWRMKNQYSLSFLFFFVRALISIYIMISEFLPFFSPTFNRILFHSNSKILSKIQLKVKAFCKLIDFFPISPRYHGISYMTEENIISNSVVFYLMLLAKSVYTLTYILFRINITFHWNSLH